MDPPFKPSAGRPEDTTYFEKEFTRQGTDLPPLWMGRDVRKLAVKAFRGFSFDNEEYDD